MKTQLPSKYPWKSSREPQRVPEPQVENHCYRALFGPPFSNMQHFSKHRTDSKLLGGHYRYSNSYREAKFSLNAQKLYTTQFCIGKGWQGKSGPILIFMIDRQMSDV